MQAKMLNFKQPLEVNATIINKKKDFKGSDFSKKLDLASKDKVSLKRQSEEKRNNPKTNNENKVDRTKEKEVNKEVDLEEKVKEEDDVQYENIINILNLNKIEEASKIEIDTSKSEESLDLLESLPNLEENSELEDQLLLTKDYELINPKENEDHSKNLKEFNLEDLEKNDLINLDQKESKSESSGEKIVEKEINLESNEFEEVAVVKDENISKVKENSNENSKDEFKDGNQENTTDTSEEYELVKTSESEEGPELSNDSFSPIIKNGLEFSTDNIIETEIPQVEPKEVVKQIVDQVKFDLSESKNEIKLTLKPEALGEMTMNIEVSKDGIIAKIMVDNYNTKEVIESNIFQLKEGIKDTGMEIKTFEVFVGNGSDFDQHESGQFNFNQNNKRLKIKNQNKRANSNFIEAYEDGTINENNEENQIKLNGGLNLFA